CGRRRRAPAPTRLTGNCRDRATTGRRVHSERGGSIWPRMDFKLAVHRLVQVVGGDLAELFSRWVEPGSAWTTSSLATNSRALATMQHSAFASISVRFPTHFKNG